MASAAAAAAAVATSSGAREDEDLATAATYQATSGSSSSVASTSSSVETTPIDISATRQEWRTRERRASVDLHNSSNSGGGGKSHHRRTTSTATSMADVAAPPQQQPPLRAEPSLTQQLASIPADQLQALLTQALLQQQQQQQLLQTPPLPPQAAYAPTSTLSSVGGGTAAAAYYQPPNVAPPNGYSPHHHHHHENGTADSSSSSSRFQEHAPPSSPNVVASYARRFAWMLSSLVVLVLAIYAALYVSKLSGTPVTPTTVAWRMAHVLEADFCIPVSPEEVRAGKAQGGQIDLRALRQTMIVHINANGLKGMCAQHLEGAKPMCQCVLRMNEPLVDGRLSQASDSDFLDLYNLEVKDYSEEKVFAVRERSVFCTSGAYWIERYLLVSVRYLGADGEYYRTSFNGSLSAIIQNLHELHHGHTFCTVDGNRVLLRQLRDMHLYGGGMSQQRWNAQDHGRAKRLAVDAQAPPPRLRAPDGAPVYRSISLDWDWNREHHAQPPPQQQQQQQPPPPPPPPGQ